MESSLFFRPAYPSCGSALHLYRGCVGWFLLYEQPWRFLLGRKGDASWDTIFGALSDRNQSWAAAARSYAGFAKKTFTMTGGPNMVVVHDLGAASTNLSLQAAALGIHTHGMAGFDREKLQVGFAIPDDFEPVACWAIGYLGM